MIARDGFNISLWQDEVSPFESVSEANHEVLYDVVIVGGGITGISTALLLQQSGKKCLVIEAKNLCFGTTGGTTAHLNTLLDTPYTTIIKNFNKENATLVAKAANSAVDLVKSNITKYQIECDYQDVCAYLFSQDNDQTEELDEIHDATVEVGLDVSYSLSLPVQIDFQKTIEVRGQGKFDPLRYVYALAAAYEKAGGTILQQTRVTGIEETNEIKVETSLGNFRAHSLIYATHIPPGINLLHLRCEAWRTYAMAATLKKDKYPKDLSYDMVDPYHYIRSQKIGKKEYIIVGGEDHKTGEGSLENRSFLKLEAYIRKNFDVDQIVYKWSSQYFESADGLPYIGHLPGHPGNVFVATGFGGNGMTYSAVAAEVLSDMILGKNNPYTHLFDPNRIKPVAGFTTFLKHNADVIKKFLGRWFDGDRLNEFADIAPGEGRVVKFEGEKMALYKSESGELYAVSSECTHMKCSIAWNGVEKSWDCPCHGSRFSFDGTVLTGPADHDLELIEIKTLIAQK